MNPFTSHCHHQGVTYFEHWYFAMGIACRVLASVFAFVVHAMLPFISIDPAFDLESTANYLAKRNAWIESQKIQINAGAYARFAASN